MYEDCKCYLENIEVRKKHFIFGCENCGKKKIAIKPKCYIPEFFNLFNSAKKNLKIFVLLLRKIVMCYEYIDSWEKLKKYHYHEKKKNSAP